MVQIYMCTVYPPKGFAILSRKAEDLGTPATLHRQVSSLSLDYIIGNETRRTGPVYDMHHLPIVNDFFLMRAISLLVYSFFYIRLLLFGVSLTFLINGENINVLHYGSLFFYPSV